MRKMDQISELPELVKEKILTFLPIKEAAKTSLLSSKWRNTWTSMPDLVLKDENIKQIDKIFSLRSSPILKFQLFSEFALSNKAFDRWMCKLQKYGIQELIVGLNRYIMPSSFFACNALRHVNLEKCTLILPKAFDGFKSLQTLELRLCPISEANFEKLISGCPLLENLFLELFNEFIMLKICSSSLRNLDFWGEFKYIHLETPNLAKAWIRKFMPTSEMSKIGFSNILDCLNNVEILEINKFFLMDLAKGPFVNKLPNSFDKLKEIIIEINLEDHNEADLALQIFNISPKLQHITLKIYSSNEWIQSTISNWPNSETTKEYLFKKLESLTISNSNASGSVLSFLRLMMLSAPTLEKLVLYKLEPNSVFLNKLLEFEKLSNEVQIIVY